MSTILDVKYRRKDGVTVRTYAFYSYRSGPVGEWMVGDVPLDQIKRENEIVSLCSVQS